ncbi:hypothetical protein [Prosthecobacter sp.]|uniref:hypothetical protein n=1 Tax=Prosthecobacter sp. TaxID=1965333 RepID=UPI0037832033
METLPPRVAQNTLQGFKIGVNDCKNGRYHSSGLTPAPEGFFKKQTGRITRSAPSLDRESNSQKEPLFENFD